jgi:hypothetical protein
VRDLRGRKIGNPNASHERIDRTDSLDSDRICRPTSPREPFSPKFFSQA